MNVSQKSTDTDIDIDSTIPMSTPRAKLKKHALLKTFPRAISKTLKSQLHFKFTNFPEFQGPWQLC